MVGQGSGTAVPAHNALTIRASGNVGERMHSTHIRKERERKKSFLNIMVINFWKGHSFV